MLWYIVGVGFKPDPTIIHHPFPNSFSLKKLTNYEHLAIEKGAHRIDLVMGLVCKYLIISDLFLANLFFVTAIYLKKK